MEFYIVNMTADILEPLAIYSTSDEAFENLESFCNVYPHGWLEVMNTNEYIIACGK